MPTYRNGEVPASLLREVSNFSPLTSSVNAKVGSNLLRADAWAGLVLLQAAFLKEFGRALKVSEAYRKRALQEYYWDLYNRGIGNLAAKPGTSKHGWAISLDLQSTTFGTTTKKWLDENAPRFGWHPTGNDFAPREGWHYDYIENTATETIPSSGGATPFPTTPQEDTLSAAEVKQINDYTEATALATRAKIEQEVRNAMGEMKDAIEKLVPGSEKLYLLKTDASDAGAPAGTTDTWCLNPKRMTYAHMRTPSQASFFAALGAEWLPGVQPDSVLAGLTAVNEVVR